MNLIINGNSNSKIYFCNANKMNDDEMKLYLFYNLFSKVEYNNLIITDKCYKWNVSSIPMTIDHSEYVYKLWKDNKLILNNT